MKTVAIHDAKTNLSKYIAAAKRGEKIYIGNHAKPEVELVIVTPSPKPKRKIGVLKGKLSAEEINQLLTYDKHKDPEWQQIVDLMNNGPIFPDDKHTS